MSSSNTAAAASSSALTPIERIRRRRSGNNSSAVSRSGSGAGMNKLYSEEFPGLKVDPIVVLVLSLIFIGSVFLLHIWGKLTKG